MGKRSINSSEKNEIIEKYNNLSAQSETLRRRLSLTLQSPGSEITSPPITPFATERTLNYMGQNSQPYPMPIWSPHTYHDPTVDADELSLYELNQQIKSTLMALLNCEEVKRDKATRAWVQSALMNAEHELKRQRRRRSSVVTNETLKAFDSTASWSCGPSSGTWR